jgi:hypothetical protein
MTNSPNNCGSSPEYLVEQTILAAKQAGVGKNCNDNLINDHLAKIMLEKMRFQFVTQLVIRADLTRYTRRAPNMAILPCSLISEWTTIY